MAADRAYKMGESPLDGQLMFKLAKEMEFDGKSGRVVLDENRDRIGDYKVWALNPDSVVYTQMMDIMMTGDPGEVRRAITSIMHHFKAPESFAVNGTENIT